MQLEEAKDPTQTMLEQLGQINLDIARLKALLQEAGLLPVEQDKPKASVVGGDWKVSEKYNKYETPKKLGWLESKTARAIGLNTGSSALLLKSISTGVEQILRSSTGT